MFLKKFWTVIKPPTERKDFNVTLHRVEKNRPFKHFIKRRMTPFSIITNDRCHSGWNNPTGSIITCMCVHANRRHSSLNEKLISEVMCSSFQKMRTHRINGTDWQKNDFLIEINEMVFFRIYIEWADQANINWFYANNDRSRFLYHSSAVFCRQHFSLIFCY